MIQDTYSYGSFGPEVSITVTTYPGVGGNPPTAPAGGIFDNAIKVTGWNANINAPGPNFNMEANNNATVDLISMGNSFQVYATNGGSYNINLPVTGIPIGYRLFIYNFSDTYVSGGAACRIPAANFRNGADLIIPHGYAHAELEFDGQLWCVVVPPPAMAASTSWDPASVAAGTSATTTVAMTGAIVGDKVAIGFSNDLQGMVLSAYVSAANSVTAVLFNPTGSTINLASGTLRARIA